MTLAVDQAGFETAFTAATSVSSSVSITVGAAASLLVLGWAGGTNSLTGPTFGTPTWAGQSMTPFPPSAIGFNTDGVNTASTELWYLFNPTPGLQTLSLTWTGSQNGGIAAISFSGATLVGGGFGPTGSSSGPSISPNNLSYPQGLRGDFCVAALSVLSVNINSVSNTSMFRDNVNSTLTKCAMWYGQTQTLSAVLASSAVWAASIGDISGPPFPPQIVPTGMAATESA